VRDTRQIVALGPGDDAQFNGGAKSTEIDSPGVRIASEKALL